jgi:hypothetical protein
MVWVLLTMTVVLTVLVGTLIIRLGRLEQRLVALASSDTRVPAATSDDSSVPSADAEPASVEFVITRVGEASVEEPSSGSAPTVAAPVFADLVLKETVVQTASLFHGLRRALSPETRNRIRFHMRQEVKRSRKQRRAELREVRREWAARQRAAMAAEEGSAA